MVSVKKFFYFLLGIGSDLWIWSLSFMAITGMASVYSADQVFWLFVVLMVSPVVPLVVFYAPKKAWQLMFICGLLLLPIFFLIPPKSFLVFVPDMPFLELMVVFTYSFMVVALGYYVDPSERKVSVSMLYTAFRLLASFFGFILAIYFSQESFSVAKGTIVLFSIPIYIVFSILIFYHKEIVKKETNN